MQKISPTNSKEAEETLYNPQELVNTHATLQKTVIMTSLKIKQLKKKAEELEASNRELNLAHALVKKDEKAREFIKVLELIMNEMQAIKEAVEQERTRREELRKGIYSATEDIRKMNTELVYREADDTRKAYGYGDIEKRRKANRGIMPPSSPQATFTKTFKF